MRWNIGFTSTAVLTPENSDLPPAHPAIPATATNAAASSSRPPPQCPMHQADQSTLKAATKSMSGAAKCPVQHDTIDSLNPLNSIPKNLSVTRAPGQVMDLSTERTASTIPRPKAPDDDPYPSSEHNGRTVWDYPSPQQFYNALVRKGWETPEESIDMVVDIHNFINEQAWQEVMKWESRLPNGEMAQLAKFQGRPGELSPKARLHLWAGKLFPSKFNTTPPFDRHDWIVTRPLSQPEGSEPASGPRPEVSTRYVIDYYSAPEDEEGNPVFVLDVRPALDSLESINLRLKVGLEEWLKGQKE